MKSFIGRRSHTTSKLLDKLLHTDLEGRKKLIRGCLSKVRYDNMGEVADVMSIIWEERKQSLNFYKCKHCGGYHLTSQKFNKKKAK
tara:strand:- start:10906 stop:11163 length:258 start_codon:yes stop_codon:yes gene_type:complete